MSTAGVETICPKRNSRDLWGIDLIFMVMTPYDVKATHKTDPPMQKAKDESLAIKVMKGEASFDA